MCVFGYVRAYKPELKFKEYDVYKGVYCSLCKSLLRRYSPLGQLFLTYDATFMALCLLSVSDESTSMRRSRCCYNPRKKCYSCGRNETLDFCADVSVLLAYYKILDDLHDRGFLKKIVSVLLFPVLSLMRRKAAKAQPQAQQIIAEAMHRQALCEGNPCESTDAAAEPSADALKKLIALRSDSEDLQHLFYLLGRYVYIIDAVDDLESDVRRGNFNPLSRKYRRKDAEFSAYGMTLLNLNIGEMLRCFDRLHFGQNADLIYNILFNGLYNSALYATGAQQRQEVDE